MITFKKHAAQVIDQQHDIDRAILWNIIEPYWPSDLDEPSIGYITKDASFAVEATCNNFDVENFYPIHTKEATLASSMYFLLDGINAFTAEDQLKIASRLKKARIQWGVSLPEDFIEEARNYHLPEEKEDPIYADNNKAYNISSPEDIEKSASKFQSNILNHSSDEILKIAMVMQKAASFFDLDIEIPYADIDISLIGDVFVESIEKRAELVAPFFNSIHEEDKNVFSGYLSDLDSILDFTDKIQTSSDVIKLAHMLDESDRKYGINNAWDSIVLSPVDALYYGTLNKIATIENNDVDWSDLSTILDSELASRIAESPEDVIPTLSEAQRNLVEEYARR